MHKAILTIDTSSLRRMIVETDGSASVGARQRQFVSALTALLLSTQLVDVKWR
jgi:hypothetical protein